MRDGLYADEEYLAGLDARAREAKEQYRIHRLNRLVSAGYTLKQANQLELAGVACHSAEDILAAGAMAEQALRILV